MEWSFHGHGYERLFSYKKLVKIKTLLWLKTDQDHPVEVIYSTCTNIIIKLKSKCHTVLVILTSNL